MTLPPDPSAGQERNTRVLPWQHMIGFAAIMCTAMICTTAIIVAFIVAY